MTPTLIDQLKLAIQVESGEVPRDEIEARHLSGIRRNKGWFSVINRRHVWDFGELEYRRKPKPLERWFVFYDDRSAMSYESSDMARNAFDREKNSIIQPIKIVHMREVTND